MALNYPLFSLLLVLNFTGSIVLTLLGLITISIEFIAIGSFWIFLTISLRAYSAPARYLMIVFAIILLPIVFLGTFIGMWTLYILLLDQETTDLFTEPH